MATRLIEVRGTRYYRAGEALAAGRLGSATPVLLVPRPDNPHDCHAVEIRLLDGTLLGYVPRERSAEFSRAVRDGRVAGARVRSAHRIGERVDITVEVEFSSGLPLTAPPSATRPAPSAVPLPSTETVEQVREASAHPVDAAGQGSTWFWWLIGILLLLWLFSR
jgi:hypothetical protein